MRGIHIGIIGFLAGTLTTVAFVPQILKITRTKHVRDISFFMYVILSTGILLWLIYGLLIKEAPIILANFVAFILCSYIMAMKLVYGRKDGAL